MQVEETIARMRATPPTQPISGRRTITPKVLVQMGATMELPWTSSIVQLLPTRHWLVTAGPSTLTNPSGSKVE